MGRKYGLESTECCLAKRTVRNDICAVRVVSLHVSYSPSEYLLIRGSGIGLPLGYDGAEHTYLKGTRTNATHWTVNALCRGCTGWQNSEDTRYFLNGTGVTEFAWAYGVSAVEDTARNDSAFNVHQAWGSTLR